MVATQESIHAMSVAEALGGLQASLGLLQKALPPVVVPGELQPVMDTQPLSSQDKIVVVSLVQTGIQAVQAITVERNITKDMIIAVGIKSIGEYFLGVSAFQKASAGSFRGYNEASKKELQSLAEEIDDKWDEVQLEQINAAIVAVASLNANDISSDDDIINAVTSAMPFMFTKETFEQARNENFSNYNGKVAAKLQVLSSEIASFEEPLSYN